MSKETRGKQEFYIVYKNLTLIHINTTDNKTDNYAEQLIY